MRLRGKILSCLIATLALLVVALYAVAHATVLTGFVELESNSMTLDTRRVRDAFARDVIAMSEKSGDWALWDDMYEFILKPDARFIQSTVNFAAANSMRLDVIVIADNRGVPLVKEGYDRQSQTLFPVPEGLLAELKPGGVLNPVSGSAQATPISDGKLIESDRLISLDPPSCPAPVCAGVLRVGSHFFLVASRPVLRSDLTGPPVGRVVFARRVDDATILELAARTHVSLRTVAVNIRPDAPTGFAEQGSDDHARQGGTLSPATVFEEGSSESARFERLLKGPERAIVVAPINAKEIVGETLVRDLTGVPAFVMRVESRRNIVERGRRSLAFFAVSLGAAGIVFGAVTYLAIDRMVLARLLRLSEDVQRISRSDATLGRVRQDGRDELSSLAGAINSTVAAIELSQALLRQREAEARKLALVAARTDNLVVITDPQGRIEWVNEGFTRHTGYALSEVVGRKPGQFLQGPATDPATVQHIRQQLAQGSGFHVEILNYRKNGSVYWLDVEVQPIFDDAGRIIHFMAVEKDVTQSRKLTQELRDARDAAEAASRAKSQFLANMSHEIRTPMTAILGFAELLTDPQTTPSQRDNYSHAIVRNGHHLLATINDILDLSKIEAGRMTIEQVPTSVTQVLAEVVAINRQRALEKKLAFEVRYLSPIPASIRTDPFRLRQIITNLVSNAVKFTESGSVVVRVSMLDAFDAVCPQIQFEVVDTGPGIPPERQESIFKPFTQADASTTRRFGGTGLGLTISRRLAQLMGGDIRLESGVGRGSHFALILPTGPLAGVAAVANPAAEQAAFAEPAIPAAIPVGDAPRPLEGAAILLAEDGIDNQRLLTYLLSAAGAQVRVVGTGAAAVETVLDSLRRNERLDLVLMDMQMPELDGYDATRRLRGKGVKLPIIALTAHAMSTDRDKCLQAGCDDYISKPVNRERLLRLVADHLASARTKA